MAFAAHQHVDVLGQIELDVRGKKRPNPMGRDMMLARQKFLEHPVPLPENQLFY